MELLELDLGADIDARLQRWQVRKLECTQWLDSLWLVACTKEVDRCTG